MIKKSVKEMSAYSAPMEGRAIFRRFDFNESTIDPSPKVKDALRKFIDSGKLNTYPHDYPLLQKKISEYVGVDENCIRITDGADGAIEAVGFACLEKGDKVIIPSPSFGMFYIPSGIEGTQIIKPEYGDNMEFPTDKVLSEIDDKTKLIIICNPNNPTGTLVKKQDIIKILESAKDAAVMIDEVYYEFTGESCIDLIKKYPNLFVIRSFSKAFSLASARVGYIVSDSRNILEINKVVAPYNVNQFGVIAAIAALENSDYMQNYVKEVMNKSKPLLEDYLKKNKIKFYHGAANFMLVEVGDSKKFYESLKEKGILVRPQRGKLESCIRISLGTLKDTREFIEIFDEIIKKRNKTPKIILAFDNDGVLRDESVSYLRCIRETVAFFDFGKEASESEMTEAIKESNNDWESTFNILVKRKVKINFQQVKEHFQDLYLGVKRDFSGYINNEPWLADNNLLKELTKKCALVIISGAPKEEIVYTLKRNNALDYFSLIIGMEECKDKLDGMMKVRAVFNPLEIFFCDDRPSPLKKLKIMKSDFKLNLYGILPPKVNKDWEKILIEAGAEKVFANVNEYCKFLLNKK